MDAFYSALVVAAAVTVGVACLVALRRLLGSLG